MNRAYYILALFISCCRNDVSFSLHLSQVFEDTNKKHKRLS